MIKKYLNIFNFIKLFNIGITFLSVVPYFYILKLAKNIDLV